MTHKRETELNVAMVGYYNTLPFLYGLKKSDAFNLILDIPSKCMDYFHDGKADVALVPVASLLGRSDYKIISDYCIGCTGSVRTVCIFSNGTIENVSKIYLDRDSRTSQLLVKTLCQRHWKIEPDFEEIDVRTIETNNLKDDEAVLMIGDKVFELENSFAYSYDLGIEWEKLTNLPFAFAVWIARPFVEENVINDLNKALGIGVNNINSVLDENTSLATRIDLTMYFKEYIDYHFDAGKRMALNQFFEYNTVLSE